MRLNLFKIEKDEEVTNFLKEGSNETVSSLQKKWLSLSDEDKKGWYIAPDSGKEYSLIDEKSSPDDESKSTINLFTLDKNVHIIQRSSGVVLESDYLKKVWDDLESYELQEWVILDGRDIKIDSDSKEFVELGTLSEDELVNHSTLVSPVKVSVLLALWDGLSDEGRLGWTVLYTDSKLIKGTEG